MNYIATAPSNIALIKYMGKRCHQQNLPANASLSYTLNHLQTTVSLTTTNDEDQWQSMDGDLQLSTTAVKRFINHLDKVRIHFGSSQKFIIQSKNNFPIGTGIASSASSFAALSIAANEALSTETKKNKLSTDELAQISRTGSGSSIRSFYEPFSIWRDERAHQIHLPYKQLIHRVIIIDKEAKKTSSSEAHRNIETSPLYLVRLKHIERRLDTLINMLDKEDWGKAYRLIFDEFIEMHELFHTAAKPFSYLQNTSKQVLDELKTCWRNQGDGPLITMDAGPNIHLLYRPDQINEANRCATYYQGYFNVI